MPKIAIISDIHSNLEAFKAVLKEIKKLNIDKIYCCGDIVGYGAEPNKCIELVRKEKIISVKGNHDIGCVNLQDKELFNEWGKAAIEWSNKVLSQENKQFLFDLPNYLEAEGIYFVHGSPRDYLWEYVYPSCSGWDFREFFKMIKKDILVMGHTHVPFIKQFEGRLAINPGSVGQPRDKDSKACFCIFDTTSKKAEIKRVEYDIKKTADKIIKAGLPVFLAERLFKGR
jgi:predicted phosphodiesterase